MDTKRFDDLANRIEEKSYTKAYASKAKLWYYAGLFFQALNIAICFLGLHVFLGRVFPTFFGKTIVLAIVAGVLLIFWEALKRLTFIELITKFLKAKFKFHGNQVAGLLLAGFLIAGSGYLAIRGANEISDTTTEVVLKADNSLGAARDSTEKRYERRILILENQSTSYVALAAEKGRPMNRREAEQVQIWAGQIKDLKKERADKLNDLESRLTTSVGKQKEAIHSTSVVFLLMTLGIESIILFCIAYGASFDFSSYQEMSNDERFHQHRLHLFLLKLIFQDGRMKEGMECMPTTRLEEIVKIKRGSTVGATEIKAFYTLMTTYDIIKTRGNKRMFLKDYPKALETFEENYN